MHIRAMGPGDVGPVAIIERTSPSAWPASSLVHELARPYGLQLVAVDDGDMPVGWCCGLCATTEAELFKIAVAPKWRRLGVASALLRRFETLCLGKGAESCFLEVRAANSEAISLYERFGYVRVGFRKKYYSDPQDDALVLKRVFPRSGDSAISTETLS